MTANTAAQWSQVSDQLSAQQREAERIRALADVELAKITLENGGSPSQSVTQATVAAGIATAQAQDLQSQTRSANIQVTRASETEPGTTTVPAPANSNPGNNTDVPPFVQATQVAATQPASTEIAARRVVLPAQSAIAPAQTFTSSAEIVLPPPTNEPAVIVTQVATPIVEARELPPLPAPELIAAQEAGQFDGVIVPQTQQIPEGFTTLAPSEIDISRPQQTASEEINTLLAPSEIAIPINIPTIDDFEGVDAQARRIAEENATLGELGINTDLPIVGGVQQARTSDQIVQRKKSIDWRFKISISPEANYLYLDPTIKTNDLLYPLIATKGVIFPYTPKIDVTYQANYEAQEITHTNYKFYNYRNSSVEQVSITGDFTAQDTYEANYLLAVIHFFKSVTKMFYGKDQNPSPGVPPPLCYLNGHGTYAFNNHPCVITSFGLNYPTDVDYVNAKIPIGGLDGAPTFNKPTVGGPSRVQRLLNLNRTGLSVGGFRVDPIFRNPNTTDSELTRVPSKLTITINALPIVTRNDVSNNFSLKNYAKGELLLSSRKKNTGRKSYGGFW